MSKQKGEKPVENIKGHALLGAYLLGTLTLVVTIQFFRWGETRFFVHQPVAAAPQ